MNAVEIDIEHDETALAPLEQHVVIVEALDGEDDVDFIGSVLRFLNLNPKRDLVAVVFSDPSTDIVRFRYCSIVKWMISPAFYLIIPLLLIYINQLF